ncbi:hypothetical protein GPECTOR_9g429 [Gonium pectorale]|uniref:RING-type domain-containing protein n=1 Tax=Gonium pectorale TaxID=33097 RepID=A0A150GRC0_GONPE|nr:hypothetical protein GPECTOR_9g429 [Gonium pectorale]|eukprot:KXZ52385.1 hypothetical protein GPECTOR_9g429 [Gonium pectorale]
MGCSSSVHAAPANAADSEQGAKQPVTADSRLLRGQAYYAAGRTDEALKELNAAIAAWPDYSRAYLERGNVRLDQKDYTLALGDYDRALQLQGNLLQGYVMRCHTRLALQQFAEALADAREAEKLDPENAQVRALKARVRKAQAAAAAGVAVAPSGASSSGSVPSEEDAFAGADTPKSTPSPSVRKLCMVCMDAERECRLRPCFHAALCVECAEGLMARGYGCPICSSKIEQVERGTFMRTFTVEEAQGLVASARVGASPAPSPGKSPLGLGRRFVAGSVAGPSPLEHIAEVDEEAHEAADSAAAAAAATTAATTTAASDAAAPPARSSSAGSTDGGSSGGGGAPPPPVELDPHPLAARSSNTARGVAVAAAAALVPPGDAAADLAAEPMVAALVPRPPPLPGAVEVAGEEVAEAAVRPHSAGGGAAAAEAEAPSRAEEPGPAPERERCAGGGSGGEAAETVETAAEAAETAAAAASDDTAGSGCGGGGGDGDGDGVAARSSGDGAEAGARPESRRGEILRLPASSDSDSSGAAAQGAAEGGSGGPSAPQPTPARATAGGASVDDDDDDPFADGGDAISVSESPAAPSPPAPPPVAAAPAAAAAAADGEAATATLEAPPPPAPPTSSSPATADVDGGGGSSAAAEPPPGPFVIARVPSDEMAQALHAVAGPGGPLEAPAGERLGSGSGALSPGASATLANSLADWIDLHTDPSVEAGAGSCSGVGGGGGTLLQRSALSGQSFVGFGAFAQPKGPRVGTPVAAPAAGPLQVPAGPVAEGCLTPRLLGAGTCDKRIRRWPLCRALARAHLETASVSQPSDR